MTLHPLLNWFANNTVAANLLIILIIVTGLIAYPSIRQEPFASIPLDLIAITVNYPGATPDEVEQAVCVPIEEAIKDVPGIGRVRSLAAENYGRVTVKIAVGADHAKLLDDINLRLDRLSLPKTASRPRAEELIDDRVLLSVVVYGDTDELTLRQTAERVRDEISSLTHVGVVDLAGGRPYEITIEARDKALLKYGITLDDVVDAVSAFSVALPGGTLQTTTGEILLRTNAQATRGRQFENVLLLDDVDGRRVRLRDVAQISDGFHETPTLTRLDGKPAMLVRLLLGKGKQTVQVGREIANYVEVAQQWLPHPVELAIWGDESRALKERRDLITRNGAQGLVLVVLALVLFMPLRLAAWITLGIPVAFLGAISVMALLDVSINMISLLAFIIATGIVVDDSIVIGEGIDRQQQRYGVGSPKVMNGVSELSTPIILAVLTTVLFLLPVLWTPGTAPKLARSLPIIVTACLLFSLIESLLVLPAHLRRSTDERKVGGGGTWLRFTTFNNQLLASFVAKVYKPLLERVIRWPTITISSALAVLVIVIAMLVGGLIPFNLFPAIESDSVTATFELPQGAPQADVERVIDQIERAVARVREELDAESENGQSVFEHILTSTGEIPDQHDDLLRGNPGSHVGQVKIGLASGELRQVSSQEIETRWRTKTGQIPETVSLSFTGSDISSDPAINILVAGKDPRELENATQALKQHLALYDGIREISDSRNPGKTELHLSLRVEAETYGITLAELTRQVRQGFYGQEVQRIQRGRDEVPVVVQYPKSERSTIADLDRVWIRTPDGREVPFPVVGRYQLNQGYSAIERTDFERTLNVYADIDRQAVADEVHLDLVTRVVPELEANFQSVKFYTDGEKKEEDELLNALARDWLIVSFIIYIIMAVWLRSYLKPIAVLSSIPFGLIGAIIGHGVFGIQFSAFSIMGMMALSGVVVSDAIVLVTAIERARKSLPVNEAILRATEERFRPILLTSITTMLGLTPLLMEVSAQAQWIKPIVVSLAFGVLFSTAVTLLLVPAIYMFLEHQRALASSYIPRPQNVRPQALV